MLACVDVDYRDAGAVAACVVFENWEDAAALEEHVVRIDRVEAYEPGAFYRRELPCLLAVLERVTVPLTGVVIDGYVWLAAERPGLGARLYDALDRTMAVIGVAKTAFRGNDAALEVLRGSSKRPLFVTAEGTDVAAAADGVRRMHGAHRIPTLLALVDRRCRSAA